MSKKDEDYCDRITGYKGPEIREKAPNNGMYYLPYIPMNVFPRGTWEEVIDLFPRDFTLPIKDEDIVD